jgi:AcrR family transcriptional regulator
MDGGTSIVRRPPFGTNPLVGERGTDTRRKILGAALEVFGDVGFNEARVELITKRAGCSRPAFYQYFSSKDELFWELAGQLGREMVQLGHRLDPVTPDAAGVTALESWIGEFVDLYGTYSPVFSAFQAASRSHDSMAQRSSGISDRMGTDLLRAFGIQGRGRRNVTMATGVVAVLLRCSFYWRNLEGTVDHDRLVGGLAVLVHRAFAGPIEGVNVHHRDTTARAVPDLPDLDLDGDEALRPRGRKTRQLLLDAGTRVLPARGYHDARVDDIVDAAGVSHGSFYRYFQNKEEFFRVLAEEASTQMVELLEKLQLDAPEAELRGWLDDWLATYESNGGIISTWQEMQDGEADLHGFGQRVAATVLNRLMAMLDERGFGDPLVDALALLALIERMPYSVFTLRFTKRAEAIDAMVLILRRGFLGVDSDALR